MVSNRKSRASRSPPAGRAFHLLARGRQNIRHSLRSKMGCTGGSEERALEIREDVRKRKAENDDASGAPSKRPKKSRMGEKGKETSATERTLGIRDSDAESYVADREESDDEQQQPVQTSPHFPRSQSLASGASQIAARDQEEPAEPARARSRQPLASGALEDTSAYLDDAPLLDQSTAQDIPVIDEESHEATRSMLQEAPPSQPSDFEDLSVNHDALEQDGDALEIPKSVSNDGLADPAISSDAWQPSASGNAYSNVVETTEASENSPQASHELPPLPIEAAYKILAQDLKRSRENPSWRGDDKYRRNLKRAVGRIELEEGCESFYTHFTLD